MFFDQLVFPVIIFFVVKHFIVDFLLQPAYMYKNKGIYGHPGGLYHSGLHALVTFVFLLFILNPIGAFNLALLEFIIHYHIDWAKIQVCQKKGWGPTTSEWYWYTLGLDQFLHYMTYVWFLYLLS